MSTCCLSFRTCLEQCLTLLHIVHFICLAFSSILFIMLRALRPFFLVLIDICLVFRFFFFLSCLNYSFGILCGLSCPLFSVMRVLYLQCDFHVFHLSWCILFGWCLLQLKNRPCCNKLGSVALGLILAADQPELEDLQQFDQSHCF